MNVPGSLDEELPKEEKPDTGTNETTKTELLALADTIASSQGDDEGFWANVLEAKTMLEKIGKIELGAKIFQISISGQGDIFRIEIADTILEALGLPRRFAQERRERDEQAEKNN